MAKRARQAPAPNRPRAFSYLRFSTPEQAQGDSFRRQSEAAREYAERHGLDLDEALTFRDLGVSAFRGANMAEGALGQFVAAVDEGRVPKGSFLLVENLDRLSRDRIMPALNRFTALLERGVTVVTLADGKVYTADSLNNLPDLMLSLLTMHRAHEESETKSRRIRAAWQAKRDRAAAGELAPITAKAPAWLVVRDGAFVVREDRAEVVRRIFALAIEGHGKEAIARKLNLDGVEPFGDGEGGARKADGWRKSYVAKLLDNPAVIGRYQPHRRVYVEGVRKREPDGPPIDGYFPAIVAETDFYRVRKGASGHGSKPLANVLSGLARCSLCGGSLIFVNKGTPPKGGSYLACDNARRKGTCTAKSVRYPVVAMALVHALDDADWNVLALLGKEAPASDRAAQLAARLDAIEGQLRDAEAATGNLLDVLSRMSSQAIERRLSDMEAAAEKLRAERATVEDRLREARHAHADRAGHVAEVAEAVRELNSVLAGDDDEANGDVNVRVNASLKRIIDRVEIGITDEAREWVKAGHAWADRVTGGKPLPTPMHDVVFAKVIEGATVSIGVAFREPGRHLVIAADPRKPGRFVAGAGIEEGGGLREFTLKVWAL